VIIHARYVVPTDRDPIENGAIRVSQGRIAEIGTSADVRAASTEPVMDYGDAAVLPGFVNAHTHLELAPTKTAPAAPMADGPGSSVFARWLGRIAAELLQAPPTQAQVQAAVRDGVAQSTHAGVTTVGDITRTPDWTRPVLAGCRIRAVSFGEVIAIGNRRGLLDGRLAAAVDQSHQTDRLRIGVSPHSPYTVEPAALRACADAARSRAIPICIHLAESMEETEFTRARSGPLTEFLQAIGVFDEQIPVSGVSPLELVESTGLLTSRTLLAHCNYLGDREIDVIARSGAGVVYCPRTHAAFGHPPHRFRDMLSAGINVCVGTDSLASNPTLSILDELRFLHHMYPAFPKDTLLRMGTLIAAKALGLGDCCGSISVGKVADLCVVPVDPGQRHDWAAIFDSQAEPIAVFLEGECIWEKK
jgi:cytosine/adenosine deaminase-related metal-dependent hydrolase